MENQRFFSSFQELAAAAGDDWRAITHDPFTYVHRAARWIIWNFHSNMDSSDVRKSDVFLLRPATTRRRWRTEVSPTMCCARTWCRTTASSTPSRSFLPRCARPKTAAATHKCFATRCSNPPSSLGPNICTYSSPRRASGMRDDRGSHSRSAVPRAHSRKGEHLLRALVRTPLQRRFEPREREREREILSERVRERGGFIN